MLISEQPRGPPDNQRRFSCPDRLCGIILTRTADLVADQHGASPGLCWIQTGNLYIVSCYLSPNEPLNAYKMKLTNLEQVIRHIPPEKEIIIGGDYIIGEILLLGLCQ